MSHYLKELNRSPLAKSMIYRYPSHNYSKTGHGIDLSHFVQNILSFQVRKADGCFSSCRLVTFLGEGDYSADLQQRVCCLLCYIESSHPPSRACETWTPA
ncbi:hypothetical protein PAHAL_9G552900 [Panicum hallii]|uniref:Uncharacterized protein n=1 Tax=Panicum hallii TaxID=206008 RepID=A0A2S3ISX3_9POAL|nr:hypothetical protein PAHAL_9G552900 [Panicum hallii]